MKKFTFIRNLKAIKAIIIAVFLLGQFSVSNAQMDSIVFNADNLAAEKFTFTAGGEQIEFTADQNGCVLWSSGAYVEFTITGNYFEIIGATHIPESTDPGNGYGSVFIDDTNTAVDTTLKFIVEDGVTVEEAFIQIWASPVLASADEHLVRIQTQGDWITVYSVKFETKPTSVNSISSNNISAYPIPGNGTDLNLTLSNNFSNTLNAIKIFDITGKLVLSVNKSGSSIALDNLKLPKGICFISVSNGKNKETIKYLVN